MQFIGLDLGSISSNSSYGNFVIRMLLELEKIDTQNIYTVYSREHIDFTNKNFSCKVLGTSNGLKSDLQFMQTLRQSNTNLVIFFDHLRKIWFTKRHFTFLESLQEVSYPSHQTKGILDKRIFYYFLHRYIKNSEKILCFDAKTKEETNESFDKADEHIAVVPGFFSKSSVHKAVDISEMNLADTKDIDYVIYEGGTGNNKNFEKLIKAISLIQKQGSNIVLYVIGDELVRDIQLREYIVQNDAMSLIHFLGALNEEKKALYYDKALGVILPSLYESFPFSLTNALYYNKKIITSNIQSLKDTFGNSVEYFNPLSINQITDKLLGLKTQAQPDYSQILQKFSPQNSASALLQEINN